MIVSGKRYSFMNCDTGRVLHSGDICEFVADPFEDGFTLRSGIAYLNSRLEMGEEKVKFTLKPVGEERYLLQVDGAALTDTDEGFSPLASVGKTASPETVDACWYITEQGKTEPLRIMLLGDSLTKGDRENYPEEKKLGGRVIFSERLAANGENRFCLVGSLCERKAKIGEKARYRHEGHCGWRALDVNLKREQSLGLIDYLDAWFGKYRPDVVFSLTGTNDIATFMGRDGDPELRFTAESMAELFFNQRLYLNKILRLLPFGGSLFVSTVPGTTRENCMQSWILEYNRRLNETLAEYRRAGRRCELIDLHTALWGSDGHGLSPDKIHLSESGYALMGNVYADAFLKNFPGTIGK